MNNDSVGPILVPVDFSAHSAAALNWAAAYAANQSLPIIVLHVVHDPASAPGSYASTEQSTLRRMEDAAKDMMQTFLADSRGRYPHLPDPDDFETMFVTGLPPTRILEIAQKKGASIIVMGSQGRTGLAHFVLGSKALRVAQLSPIPVTIVKAEVA